MADRFHQNQIDAHQEWLGFVQPVGLVVSPTILVSAQVVPDRNIASGQKEFRSVLEEDERGVSVGWTAPDLRRIFLEYLGWEESDLVDATDHLGELEKALPELDVVLSPTWAVPDEDAKWMMLIKVEEDGVDLDRPPADSTAWNATRHARFERLLRETSIPVGLLCTNDRIRLIYAPKGESSGYATFKFSQMALPAGRPILAAFEMLLAAQALFMGHPDAQLPTLLAKSRDAQAEVSTRLSKQVLAALYELLRGFVAGEARNGGSVTELARTDPDQLYGGLITTLMRLIFILYAEDRGLMPDHQIYQRYYSLGGLFTKLREDNASWPDTMDQRYGAWAQLLALFRLIHDGGSHGELKFVARKGPLFDPGRFPFLEERSSDECQDGSETKLKGEVPSKAIEEGLSYQNALHPYQLNASIPMVSDACIWKVLKSLMVLDGERLSYRTLDVEQIGSVYEAIMGFRVELSAGRSIGIRSQKRTGAALIVDLDSLLDVASSHRAKELQDQTDRKLTGKAAVEFRKASTIDDLVIALDRVIDRDATPTVIPSETPILQPTDERRRSGSHYTPRSLTEPIVSEALRPILERLGERAHPEEILSINVLDPATGSGAFLVEACRQLAEHLVTAWSIHGGTPRRLVDGNELLHARRLVAQRCLYGVDRNPMAIDLARLSLWLVTLARNHEFTFIDHALCHGDSLVGLWRRQIERFHWDIREKKNQLGLELGLEAQEVDKACEEVSDLRQTIQELGGEIPEDELQELMNEMDQKLKRVRQIADVVLLSFFEGKNVKARNDGLAKYADLIVSGNEGAGRMIADITRQLPFEPFHWELEFPEVFDREDPGFDAVVGNPPFAGKNTIAAANHIAYPQWLKSLHAESHGNADLAAHFFRRAFNLLRNGGTLGLIATNTIGQGDTRSTGLRWICENGGEIYRAQRRYKWPGEAAVIVSVIHVIKGRILRKRILDKKVVDLITAFLFHGGGHTNPNILKANSGKSFKSSDIYGIGFTFDDTDKKDIATPIAEMEHLIRENPRNQEVIFPYIGGQEINSSPVHSHHRYVINFHDWPLRRTDLGATWIDADSENRKDWLREGIVPVDYPKPVAADWPELLRIVEKKVRPVRAHLTKNAIGLKRKKFWWQYGSLASELYDAIIGIDRVIAISRVTSYIQFTFLPSSQVFSDRLIIFPLPTSAAFCALQSRPHEIWARFFGSSLEDRPCYTPTDCFETFPFPNDWETLPTLEAAGETYYTFRAELMIKNNEGMTKTYNRFHDPNEHDPQIQELRILHAAMDRAVLDAYGWTDISTDCEFFLDYEIDKESWGNKKKPYRYRWPDEIHDEMLSRLLDLNAKRYEEESIAVKK